MNDLEILKYIPASSLDYESWIMVGMALKDSGASWQDWDEWSKSDSRYKIGECEKKWNNHFNGSTNPVTAGTLVHIAKQFGYTIKQGIGEEIEFGSEITVTGEYKFLESEWIEGREIDIPSNEKWDRFGDVKKYFDALFDREDFISYCSSSFKRDDSEKYLPGRSVNNKTVGSIIDEFQKLKNQGRSEQECFDFVFGTIDKEAGAWVRINPMDGKGDKDANVTSFKYALVESDNIAIDKQNTIIRELELPVAALVYSGGKSLHAIVKIDAQNFKEYKDRVDFLYEICNKNNLTLDRQNRNPSRLSRLPGIFRGNSKQFLLDTNIGKQDWEEWKEWIEELNDDLPDFEDLSESLENKPPLADELISGVLRQGHKMILAGSSKAGKSFALIQLALAIGEGKEWMSWKCKKGKVLYMNLELDRASCINRFDLVSKEMMINSFSSNVKIWHLRGRALPMDKLVPKLIRRAKKDNFSAIIVDPIYKVITGDENSAEQMAHFTNQFDKITLSLGASAIYCHHHSKGSQGGKKASDRSSGSGVFSRDPDAILDMIELHITDDMKKALENENKCKIALKKMDELKPNWKDYCNYDDDCKSFFQLSTILDNSFNSFERNEVREAIKEKEKSISKISAWRIESSLREFERADDVNVWFDFPTHTIDDDVLSMAVPEGEQQQNRFAKKGTESKSTDEKKIDVIRGYIINRVLAGNGSVSFSVMQEEFRSKRGFTGKVIATLLAKMDDVEIDGDEITMRI